MTEQEYVTLQNRVRISTALECLRHVVADEVVDEAELKEVRRRLALWEKDLFVFRLVDGEQKGARDGE